MELMRQPLTRALLALTLLPLTACATTESDDLPPCPTIEASPAAVPGLAGRIAYTTLGGGGGHCSAIVVMNADGSDRRRITQPELYPSSPQWSPDGGQFLFTGACPNPQQMEVCVMDVGGKGLRPVTSHPETSLDAVWSPDGRRIAFNRREPKLGPGDIYIIGVDGTGETRLTTEPGHERSPSWSPDGQSIAYSASEGTEQLKVVRVGSGAPTILARGGTVNQTPAFSHDGRRIAFSSNRSGKEDSVYGREGRAAPGGVLLPPSSGAHDIYVVGVDGQGLTRLTSDTSANYSPVWSPDDRHLLFTSDRDGRQELYVMAADGSRQTRLTNHPEDGAGDASWTG